MRCEGHGTSNPQDIGESLLNKLTKGSISMNANDGVQREAPPEKTGIEKGALVNSQTMFRVSELKDNIVNKVEKAGSRLQVQQQPPGTGVCWERFLHVESIRVLLVENDDSTRHVVTALLRNCNYEVLEAANGLQAWKILENLNIHIDIVLTEVVMPYIPGIPLLSKIMSHKTRKNIPVIMMSSHDSMGLVFKCLSKGAVDFLVKPIRKNELKILWQHVWRRCHSSSGSGSESGTQTQKSVKSKSSERSDNSRSDGGENDVNNCLNVGDGSDDGSGAQSSWTKQAVEIVSSQAMSPTDQVAECPDSTCAQVIRSNAENSDCNRVHSSIARGGNEQKRVDTIVEGEDLETVRPTIVEPKAENPWEIPCAVIGSEPKSLTKFNHSATVKKIDLGKNNLTAESMLNQSKGGSYETSDPLTDGRKLDSSGEVAYTLDKTYNAPIDSDEPNIERSLKRLRGLLETGRPIQDDRNVLRRSEQSAFSRYNTCSNSSKAPDEITASRSISDKGIKVTKQEPVHVQAHSTEHVIYLISSNGVGNNVDMGSTSNKLPTQQSIMNDNYEATSTMDGVHYSAFGPVKNDLRYTQQQPRLLLQSEVQTTDSVSARGSQKELLNEQPHHQNYHHHHQLHAVERQASSNHGKLSLKRMAEDAPHFGLTNASGGPLDSKGRDYGCSRSISRSNHGSSNAINASGTFAEFDVGRAGRNGSGDASGSGSGNRVDEDKVAHRKAALNKFRQKKKDRCFTKKVRYQNRKKLAEQRPRVRGQFVKQSVTDSSNGSPDELWGSVLHFEELPLNPRHKLFHRAMRTSRSNVSTGPS